MVFSCLFTGAFATQDKKQIKIRLQAQTGNLDETTVYFDQGVTRHYSNAEDVQKVVSGLAGVPVLYSLSDDNYELSNNGFSNLPQSEEIALGVQVDSDGVYTFSAPLIDKFDPTSILRLEDRQNNTFTDLRTNLYQANILANEAPTGRFFLHVSYPVLFGNYPSGCNDNDGIIEAQADNSIQWTLCELYDANNNQVGSFSNANGTLDFQNLSSGDYYMVFVYDNYTTTKQFHMNSHAIAANIYVSQVTAYTGENIDFHAMTQNATHFEWDFGDGTWIVGIANPTLSYYEAGTYTVTLKCTNDYGCSNDANVTVDIDQAITSGVNDINTSAVTVSAYGKNVRVNLNDEVSNDASMKIYNLLGQSVYNGKLLTTSTNISLDNQPSGYYLVSVSNGGKANTKRVYIGQ